MAGHTFGSDGKCEVCGKPPAPDTDGSEFIDRGDSARQEPKGCLFALVGLLIVPAVSAATLLLYV